ncbi:MAG: deoxyribonuclease IV [Patescibacteria group bacterium]
MLFGSHVSAAGGIFNAPENASKIGADIFQFFDRSPRGGKPTYNEKESLLFKKNLKKFKIQECYLHTPYYINLASSENRIRFGSIKTIRDELEAGDKLGAKYVMTHLGSAKDFTDNKALELVIDGLKQVMNGYNGKTQLLIENSAGTGQIIGDSFEEIGYLLDNLKGFSIGVCLDTCHAFASGYDFRTKKELQNVTKSFEKNIGLEKLKLFHLNDSKTEFNSHKDRHADLGNGSLGFESFKNILAEKKFAKVNCILETPEENSNYKKEIVWLKNNFK